MDDQPSYRITVTHVCGGAKAAGATLRRTAEATLAYEQVLRARINIAVVDDREIARLNLGHLDHGGPTDVLSFNVSDDRGDLEGEVVLSLDTARREADRRGHTLEAELALYVAHGILHLTGHDDAAEPDATRMHEIEDRILTSMGMPKVFEGREVSQS